MMRIIADSSCDLYSLDYEDFKTVPLSIYTAERNFVDDLSLNITEMLDYLAQYKHRSYTSCPSTDLWLEAYRGADEIFVTTVTSALSGSYNAAVYAAQLYKEENPRARVSVTDSLSTGGSEILIIGKLVELIRRGLDFEAIDRKIKAYMKTTRLFFSFFSLHNLAQNGRVNKVAAVALKTLNIGVIGTATAEGKIAVTSKARGEKKCLEGLVGEMEKAGYAGGKAVITHVENEPAAMSLKEKVLALWPGASVDIYPARGLCSYYMERKGVVICLDTAASAEIG